jgi:hypothetical protein
MNTNQLLKTEQSSASNEANNSLENGANNGNSNGKTKKRQSDGNKRRRRPDSPLKRILDKARNAFNAQLTKSNAVKLKCIENFLAGEMNDAPKFWGDFMKQVERLLDSRKYVKECQALGYQPENVAEHIVFLGSATVNKVLTLGVSNTIGSHLKLYQDRFTSADVDFYRNDIIAFLNEGKSSEQAA